MIRSFRFDNTPSHGFNIDRVPQMAGPLGWAKKKAKGAGRGVLRSTKAVASATARAAKAVDVKPWQGQGGWASNIAGKLSAGGLTGGACYLKRYSNTPFCRAVGKVSAGVGKQIVEKAYGLPPGTLDAAEEALNSAGKGGKAPAAVMVKGKLVQLPPDVRQLAEADAADRNWWDKFTAWLEGK